MSWFAWFRFIKCIQYFYIIELTMMNSKINCSKNNLIYCVQIHPWAQFIYCNAQVILPNLSWALDLTTPRKEGSLAKDLPSLAKDRPKTRVGTQHYTTPPKQSLYPHLNELNIDISKCQNWDNKYRIIYWVLCFKSILSTHFYADKRTDRACYSSFRHPTKSQTIQGKNKQKRLLLLLTLEI